jgi:anthranilate phosphoribosyltransferase
MRELLDGAGGPLRDYVLLNSAGVLLVGDLVTNIRDGVQLAARTIDSGAAKDRMESMIEVSQAGG